MLYRVVQQQLETFVARRDAEMRPVPGFVQRELGRYLECGILAHGFVRVRCTRCGTARLVAFSCKGRGFCPSCGGRRMSDTAAHLVDRVFPLVPVRQWVLSLPYPLRLWLAYDPGLCTAVLRVYLRALLGQHQRRARAEQGLPRGQSGAVTFIQRFGSALNLNVHFHTLVFDGVFTCPENGAIPEFHTLPPPSDAQIADLVAKIARRIVRLLERRGLLSAEHGRAPEPSPGPDDLLPGIYAASLRNRIATGPRAGRRVMRLGDRVDVEEVAITTGPRCARTQGFSLHANAAVPAPDRRRLERLCRYVARPAIATQRLSELADGRIAYALRHPWRDGTTHFVFEPGELVEKLVALVPRPRAHLVRYHGVLAPGARLRSRITAARAESEAGASAGVSGSEPTTLGPRASLCPPRPRRLAWADLMRRVFEQDVLEYPRCQGRMTLIATITDPKVIEAILRRLGLEPRAPPLSPARPSEPDLDLWPDESL